MKSSIKILFILSLLSIPTIVSAQSAIAVQNVIEVRGYAFRDVSPDTVYINFELQSREKTLKEANTKNREKVDSIKSALSAIGIASEAVTTLNSTVNRETVYSSDGKGGEKIKGYLGTKSYSIAVKKKELVEAVVDVINEVDVTRIESVYAPDDTQTSVDFAIEMEGETKKASRAKIDEILAKVKSGLTGLGLSMKKDLSLRSSSFYPTYSYDNPPETKEYVVNHQVQVKLGDPSQLQEVVSAVSEAGIERVANINIAVENSEAVQKELRKSAYADARQKAEEVASIAEISLGRVGAVFDFGLKPYPVDISYCCGQGTLGKVRVEAELTVQFQILQPEKNGKNSKPSASKK